MDKNDQIARGQQTPKLALSNKSFSSFSITNIEVNHLQLSQVSCAPKAKKVTKDQSEKMEPQTVAKQTKARMAEWLKAAAQSRTQSLTLSGLDFAAELRKQLLNSARSMESSYQDVSDALEKKVSDQELTKLNKKLDEQEKNNVKLQAQPICLFDIVMLTNHGHQFLFMILVWPWCHQPAQWLAMMLKPVLKSYF